MKNYQKQPIFIISSGRTGSTLISKILNSHKELCVISDLIEPVGNNDFFIKERKKISGKNFFKQVSRKTSEARIKYWKIKKTKELLYFPKKEKEISCLNCYTLPFIFKNVKKKFKQIENEFVKKKNKSKPKHLLDFFNLLKDLSHKKKFIERTGGALHHIEKILDYFPDSKIILSYRNPIETAISMRNYPFFRMYELMQNRKNLLSWNFQKKKPHWVYGKMLNHWYSIFFKNKNRIKKKNYFQYSFEALISDPTITLEKILKFILNKSKLSVYDKKFIKNSNIKIKNIDTKAQNLKAEEKKKLIMSLTDTINKLYDIKI